MKITYLSMVLCSFVNITNAQTKIFVDTTPQLKNVIIEQFTGIKSSTGGDGDKIIKTIQDANPGKVFAINIFGTSSACGANPIVDEMDLRTSEGNGIEVYAAPTTTNTGMVNRARTTALVYSKANWTATTNTQKALNSYLNVGISQLIDTLDGKNRLEVKVQVYYTADGTIGDVNYLHIALTQDSITTTMSSASSNPAQGSTTKYNQMNVLRKMLVDKFGVKINKPMAKGTLYDTTIYFDIPAFISVPFTSAGIKDIPFSAKNSKIVAFVTSVVNTTSGATEKIVNGMEAKKPAYKTKSGTNPTTTSIESNNLQGINLKVFPNPTTGNIKVSTTMKSTQISIVDITGKEFNAIKTNNNSSDVFELNTTTLKAGTYYVQVLNEGVLMGSETFIKE